MKVRAIMLVLALLPAVASADERPGKKNSPSFDAGYWGDGERGWFWYEDPVC